MGARHYDAEYGRFLQPDPSAAEANLYGYAGNGPVSRVDSSGGSWCALLLPATATGPVGIGAEALCWGITGLLALALIPPVSSLTTEIVRAAEKAARQNRPSPRKCAVIGENALRVEVKARIWHCETYSPQMNLWRGYRGPSIPEKYVRQAQLRDNAKWISRMMAEGRIIFDIGPDLVARARGQRDFLSPYYFLEYRVDLQLSGQGPVVEGFAVARAPSWLIQRSPPPGLRPRYAVASAFSSVITNTAGTGPRRTGGRSSRISPDQVHR